MDKMKLKTALYRILYKSTFLIAYAVSIGACLGNNTGELIISSLIAAVVVVITPETAMLPLLSGFLITLYEYNTVGIWGAKFSFILCAVISAFLMRSNNLKKKLNENYILGSVSLSTAVIMTVLITTLYFGIGATGNTVMEMIKSYRSLGFHPNWRGILYGTIVMVIMITFPRKFKTISKYISSEFLALLAAFLLNLWLIPRGSVEVIPLLNKADYFPHNPLNAASILSFNSIAVIFISGFALSVLMVIAGAKNPERNSIYSSAAILLQADTGYFFPSAASIKFSDIIEGIISALVMALWLIPSHGFERLPLSACAVVLIVSGWHNVKWGAIAKSFSSVKNAVLFFAVIAISVLITPAFGIIGAFAISLINERKDKKI